MFFSGFLHPLTCHALFTEKVHPSRDALIRYWGSLLRNVVILMTLVERLLLFCGKKNEKSRKKVLTNGAGCANIRKLSARAAQIKQNLPEQEKVLDKRKKMWYHNKVIRQTDGNNWIETLRRNLEKLEKSSWQMESSVVESKSCQRKRNSEHCTL